MNIIGKKTLYFIISGLIIIPGTISLILWGLSPSIDFTGGTLLEYQIKNPSPGFSKEKLKDVIVKSGVEVASVAEAGDDSYLLRMKPIDVNKSREILSSAEKEIGGTVIQKKYETVGPSVGQETTLNAVKAVLVASLFIILYIAWSFRKIPKPYSPIAFGVCAVVALIHDVLVVVGLFSILGHFLKVEVDSLFITALLTVMGFSVHDTIVVFDRVRENLRKMPEVHFSEIVNFSMNQTLVRSLSTSLTVLLTILALVLFGGESIRWFAVALLIGILSGTYSSIFNAAPLLVLWEERKKK
ncbi:protein-export membrane protein SecF [Candidatus Gottesmanbacteria bacterium RIFCSPHIGHO2_02_FULL_39_11]|uniref:Protein-export membrane protein SecF n=1 Tax=Candidatus Gottesmanbacteria bacterium RIFCSPHIGHO2_02_FULL_39_11 TaxID=1798382 RepID=A0A1F5ZSC7_9BACT|nr:MAG: protein-export membrane protein SecF [Candidatus Gottesmanbacteria bacterium RIFCSPHIGHO2_02_FULL_39_11]